MFVDFRSCIRSISIEYNYFVPLCFIFNFYSSTISLNHVHGYYYLFVLYRMAFLLNLENARVYDFSQVQMMYHTHLRNIALFTSLSLAVLGLSRWYKAVKKDARKIGYTLISIVFLLVAIMLKYSLLNDHVIFLKKMKDEEERKLIEKWYLLPKIILTANLIHLGFSVYTLYNGIVYSH